MIFEADTPAGKAFDIALLFAILMILGYGIIAVPTGIVTVEPCPHCSRYGHDADAVHCKYCGNGAGVSAPPAGWATGLRVGLIGRPLCSPYLPARGRAGPWQPRA